MNKPTCTTDACERETLARGMCPSHYSTWFRKNRKRTKTCAQCGERFDSGRAGVTMCSLKCASAKAAELREPAKPKPALKTQAELQASWDKARSAMRAAYEDAQWGDLIAALYLRSVETPEGCWEWQGQTKQSKKSSTPYAIVKWSGKSHLVHRIACQARYEKDLGTQQAHHICANTVCVNPWHLEPATHVENIAEMKARRSYEARIDELEQALRLASPAHPLLERISYGAIGR